MDRGYVKLWRKLLDSRVFSHAEALRMFIWLLLRAARKPFRTCVGRAFVDLGPGQVLASRSQLMAGLGLSPGKVVRCLKFLEDDQLVICQPTNRYTIITVVNWAGYQFTPREARALADQPGDPPAISETGLSLYKQDREKQEEKHTLSSSGRPCAGAAARGGFGPDFPVWWEAYPRKEGKGAAFAAWRACPDLPGLSILLAALERQKLCPQWRKEGGRFIPQPARYLRESRWEDTPARPEQDTLDEYLRQQGIEP